MARVPGTRARRHEPRIYVGLPTIDDELPVEVKNQIAVRNQCWVEGVCPSCGAEPELVAHVELSLVQVVFQHALDCPVAELLDPHDP